MLLYVLYTFGAIIALGLGLAASRPGAFRIERSTTIDAPPERVAANIVDFHKWTAWSPWEKLDPNLQRTYSGATSGTGAIYEWQGAKQVGAGRMEVTDSTADKVTIKLDFLRPFEAHNITEFHLQPRGNATAVTWAMHGTNPYLMKVFGLFMNMDKVVGKDFESGLASLKQVSEQSINT
jgi:hypothetical protein